MGYQTDFSGALKLSRKLTIKEAKTWLDFADDDKKYTSVSKIDSCLQWVPSQDLEHLVYDGNEKFYEYKESLVWILDWLMKIGISADGSIIWSGEETGDAGIFEVSSSEILIKDFDAPIVANSSPLTMEGLEKLALEQITNSCLENQ